MELAIISSGSNLGDRLSNLSKALNFVSHEIGEMDRISSVYQTSAWGKIDQPNFLNQVFGVYSNLEPLKLMGKLLDIEQLMGRERVAKWGPRSIDLDLLYFGQIIIKEERLTLPHREIEIRRFVLTPLSEIYPNFNHPVLGINQKTLLQNCDDHGEVLVYKNSE